MKDARIIKLIIYVVIVIQLFAVITLLTIINTTEGSLSIPIIIVFISIIIVFVVFVMGFITFFPSYKKIHRISKLNSIFYKLMQQSVYIKDKNEFYQTILDSALKCIEQGQKGSVLLMDVSKNTLYFAAAVGYDMNILNNTYLQLDQTYLYRESKGVINKTVKIHDPFEYDRKHIDSPNIDAILESGSENVMTTLSTPIFYDDELYGMINIDSPKVSAYDNYDIEVLELFAIELANVVKLFNSLEENAYYTNYDVLTDIPNRRYINEFLDQTFKSSEERESIFSVVSIDLNNLKTTNDCYGHQVGDELLKKFSDIFTHNLPNTCKIGRYAGDEFILVMPDLDTEATKKIIKVIENIFTKNPLIINELSTDISFSYGIATYPVDEVELELLFKIADQRMYLQKRLHHMKND